jgi:hypothetical protein
VRKLFAMVTVLAVVVVFAGTTTSTQVAYDKTGDPILSPILAAYDKTGDPILSVKA